MTPKNILSIRSLEPVPRADKYSANGKPLDEEHILKVIAKAASASTAGPSPAKGKQDPIDYRDPSAPCFVWNYQPLVLQDLVIPQHVSFVHALG